MKKAILIICTFVLTIGLQAQITHTSSGNVDANAQKILTAAAKKMNASPVSFSVTMVSRDAAKKETARLSAQVLFNKGRYRVTSPQYVLYSDSKSVWVWNKEAGEVTIENLSASDDLMNPAQLLSSYSQNYKAKYIRTEENGSNVIDLTPKRNRSFYKIRLIINKAQIPTRLVIHNYDGSMGEYAVSDFKSGVKCGDSDFVFDASAHKGVEVIDMR